MKLSIIIPLYNKEEYIDRCLKSLLNQDLNPNDYEIIIINDGSTDSSYSIAKEFSVHYENIHVFSQENKGLSVTRNRGIGIAKGDYVYFLDADDYLAHNVLEHPLELCKENNIEVLGFNTIETEEGSLFSSSTQNNENLTFKVVDGITFIAEYGYRNEVWWYFIKRSFLLDTEITFVEGRFIEDSIFTTNLFVRAKRFARVDLDIHRFVKVPNSIQTSTNAHHLKKFIEDLVFALEELNTLIKGLDKSHPYYAGAVEDFRRKQQSYVFTMFLKIYRCPILKFSELKDILKKLKQMGIYPISLKIGGIGNKKTRRLYGMTLVPIFNNRSLLFAGLRLKRLFSPN